MPNHSQHNTETQSFIKKLQASELFYRHLTELTPESIVIHKNGIVVFANPSALKLVGAKKRDDVVGKPILQFVHPDSRNLVVERVNVMQTQKQVAPRIEEKFVDLKGNTLSVEVTAVAIPFEDTSAFLVLIHDVSESKKIKEELEKNEERFRSLIENSADAFAIISPKGKILYASSSTSRVLGDQQELSIGKNGFMFVHPLDLPLVTKAMGKLLLRTGNTISIEVRVKNNQGNWVWLACSGKNLLANPAIKGIVVNFRNITERKKIEKRQKFLDRTSTILATSINYQTTLKNISKLAVPYLADFCRIVVLDEQGKAKEVTVNHVIPRKIRLAKKLYENYKNDSHSTYGIPQILETGKPEMITSVSKDVLTDVAENTKLISIVKELGLTSYMGIPMKVNNKIIGAITFSSTRKDRLYTKEDFIFAQEIAQRAAYAVENAQLYAKEKRAVGLRDEFISLVSHELRTPITSLKLYVQVLRKHFEATENMYFSNYFKKIDEQVSKLTLFINDLLNVSRLNYGQLDFHMNECDLNQIIKDTVSVVQETTQRHKIIVENTVTRSVWCDQYRIYQVLTNLLTNAIKYSPEADKIIISLKNKRHEVVVSVQDFGIGIAKKEQKNIFTKFYRVSNTQKMFPGLGMGLYIAYEIIKRHNGDMTLKSQISKGSTFTFTLPYQNQ